MDSPRNEQPPTLEYGHADPPTPPAKVFGGLLGIVAAIVAIPAWVIGVYVLRYALFESPTRDRPVTFLQAGVFFAIAIVCTLAAVRWVRYALRR